jgi:hypothetical protein
MAKVYQVDPLVCTGCAKRMSLIAFVTAKVAVAKILDHLGLSAPEVEKRPRGRRRSSASLSTGRAGGSRRTGTDRAGHQARRPARPSPVRATTSPETARS